MCRLFSLFLSTLAVFVSSGEAGSQQPGRKTKDAWQTPYEKSDGWQTVEYQMAIDFYRRLALEFDRVQSKRSISPC